MFKKGFLAAALLVASSVAYADAPGRGDFGLGLTLQGSPVNSAAQIESGAQLMYWATDRFELTGRFGIVTIDNGGTAARFGVGGNYYVVKNPRDSYGVFLGGQFGVNVVSPPGANSTTQIAAQFGGGAQYFFNKHFGVQIFQGLNLNSEPTTFAFVSRAALNWYF